MPTPLTPTTASLHRRAVAPFAIGRASSTRTRRAAPSRVSSKNKVANGHCKCKLVICVGFPRPWTFLVHGGGFRIQGLGRVFMCFHCCCSLHFLAWLAYATASIWHRPMATNKIIAKTVFPKATFRGLQIPNTCFPRFLFATTRLLLHRGTFAGYCGKLQL